MKSFKKFTVIDRADLKKILGAGIGKGMTDCRYGCSDSPGRCPVGCYCDGVACHYQ